MRIAILDDYQDAVRKLDCFSLLADHEVKRMRMLIPSRRRHPERFTIMANNAKHPVISAVFQDRYDAIEAHSFVKSLGYSDSEINVLMSDSTRKKFDSAGYIARVRELE